MIDGQRSGLEYFPEDGNYVYTIAQWFPRMCVFDDVNGWQNKQFLGRGEFALPFGDYRVKITVPADHIVAATGTLQNAAQVLNKTELERLERAKTSFDKPVIIVTQAEAVQKEKAVRAKRKPGNLQPTMCATLPLLLRASLSGMPWPLKLAIKHRWPCRSTPKKEPAVGARIH